MASLGPGRRWPARRAGRGRAAGPPGSRGLVGEGVAHLKLRQGAGRAATSFAAVVPEARLASTSEGPAAKFLTRMMVGRSAARP